MNICILNLGKRGCSPLLQKNIAEALANNGNHNISLCFSRNCESYNELIDLPYKYFDCDTNRGYFSGLIGLIKIFSLRKNFKSFLKDNKIKFVLSVMPNYMSALLADVVRKEGLVYFPIIHESGAITLQAKDIISGILLRREVKYSDFIITLSEYMRISVSKKFGFDKENIHVLPHPVYEFSALKVRSIKNKKELQVLFFGRIFPHKGIDLLLEAWEIVNTRLPNAKLNIVGEGNCTNYRKAIDLDSSISLDNRFVSESEIDNILDESDLVVLPYRKGSQSGVIAASMGAGIPVVCTNVGAFSEQVENGVNGLVVEDFSPSTLSKAIIRILSDEIYYKELSSNIVNKNSVDISWQVFGQNLSAIILNKNRK